MVKNDYTTVYHPKRKLAAFAKPGDGFQWIRYLAITRYTHRMLRV